MTNSRRKLKIAPGCIGVLEHADETMVQVGKLESQIATHHTSHSMLARCRQF